MWFHHFKFWLANQPDSFRCERKSKENNIRTNQCIHKILLTHNGVNAINIFNCCFLLLLL